MSRHRAEMVNALSSDVWEFLQSRMCRTRQDRFVWACARNLHSAKNLLRLPCVDIRGRNWESHTALTACLQRDLKLKRCSSDTIRWLLSEGADANASFEDPKPLYRRITPLMFACTYYKQCIVGMLLRNGARVNDTNLMGETAAHRCASAPPRPVHIWSHYSAVAIILDMLDESGADLDAHDCGFCPLLSAMNAWNHFIAVYLLCLNCDPDGGVDPPSFDPQSPEASVSAKCTPLVVAVNDVFMKPDLIGVLLLAGCRMEGVANGTMCRLPQWMKKKLHSPYRLQDLCMARIRTSLRHGPFGAAGGRRGPGLGGFRRLELGVRGLPIPLCLKRRVLMVGLRKLLREGRAKFGKRGMEFCSDDSGFLLCTPMDYFIGVEDADEDTYCDKVLV